MAQAFTTFVGTCVSFNGRSLAAREALCAMVDAGRPITYASFARHVPARLVADLLPFYAWGPGRQAGLRLSRDWSVSFHTSRYGGQRCYYLCWSAIEYIFLAGPDPIP